MNLVQRFNDALLIHAEIDIKEDELYNHDCKASLDGSCSCEKIINEIADLKEVLKDV